MSCKIVSSGTRNLRHRWVCEALAKWCRSLGAMVRLEPPRLDRNDNKRPDLDIQIANNRFLIDVSVVHPSAASYKSKSATTHLHTTTIAERRKTSKYTDMAKEQRAEFFRLLLSPLVGLVSVLPSSLSPLCVCPSLLISRGALVTLCMVCRGMLRLLFSVVMLLWRRLR